MTKLPPKKLISARISAELHHKLDHIAKIRGNGLSETVETAILLGLKKDEHFFLSELKRIVKEGGGKGMIARLLAHLMGGVK